MDVMAPNQVVSVVTTVGSATDGQAMAQALVERRLAACVQVEPIVSHYRWDDALQAQPEWRLSMKTLASRLPALEAYLVQTHPYDVPQLIWQYVWASADYARWVAQEVALPGASDPVTT